MLVASYLADLGGRLADAVNLKGLVLNLAQFDAETAQLDLGVDAAQVFELPVLVPTAEVAGVVHPHGTAPAVFLYERTIDEGLGGAFRQAPIAATHLDAGEAQFTGHALRYQMTGRVHDEVPVVGHALSDGDVLDAGAGRNAVIRGVVRTFRRPIDIDDFDVVAVHAAHFLAAARSETDGEVVEGAQQQAGHRRRITAARDLMVEEELADGAEVLADFRRHDVEGTAEGEYGVHILDVRVEGEGTVAADAVGRGQFLHIDDHRDKVAQAGLVEHRAFGLARGTAGVNHIGQTVGTGQVDGLERLCVGVGLCILSVAAACHFRDEIVDEEGAGGGRFKTTFRQLGFQHCVRSDEHLRFGIFKHIAQPFVGVFEIERGVGGAGLVDGKHRKREFLDAVEHHADKIIGLHAEIDEPAGQGVGITVHFPVRELAILVDDGRCIGGPGCLPGEESGEGFAQIHIQFFARAESDDAAFFRFAEQAEGGEGLVGMFHHP